MTIPLCLTDLGQDSGSLRRVSHGYATARSWSGLARRAASVATEVIRAAPFDAIYSLGRRASPPQRLEEGVDPTPQATRIAAYVHFSSRGRISEMVRQQLRFLAEAGFAIVFISMSTDIPQPDWEAVRHICALAVQRRNVGRDFGAWQDVIPIIRQRWPKPQELLLVNDSVLGPVHPMQPVITAMRSGGDGLFGLTESLQGGPHLQSYMLLARGRAAVDDVMLFLEQAFVSRSKWLLIQFTEIRLGRWMRQRGHRVAAVFGYDRLLRAALADPDEVARLITHNRKFAVLRQMPLEDQVALLHAWPLNPTHHLWHALVTQCGSPFVKRELVMRNPGKLPGVSDWAEVVPAEAPCSADMLRQHLETMRAA